MHRSSSSSSSSSDDGVSRSVRYRQLFGLLPPTSELSTLSDPQSSSFQTLQMLRSRYKNDSGPSEPPARRASLSRTVEIFEDFDPVFFNSSNNLLMASCVLARHSELHPSSSSSDPDFDLTLCLTVLYVLHQHGVTSSPSSRGRSVPSEATSPDFIEHDAFIIYTTLKAHISSTSTDKTLPRRVMQILSQTNPSLYAKSSVEELVASTCVDKLFLPLCPFPYLLQLWDSLFNYWESNSDVLQPPPPPQAPVYFNPHDPLSSGPAPPPPSLVPLPPLLPEIIAAVLLYCQSPPSPLSQCFSSPDLLPLAASLLIAVPSVPPALLPTFLNLPPFPHTTATFGPGPLGLLLRHTPTGLVVNSFQPSSPAANLGVRVGDLLALVNGYRLPPALTAHGLVALISQIPRPVDITFLHADIRDTPPTPTSTPDSYDPPLLPSENTHSLLLCHVRSSSYNLPGGSSDGKKSWTPCREVLTGGLWVTDYRLLFHATRDPPLDGPDPEDLTIPLQCVLRVDVQSPADLMKSPTPTLGVLTRDGRAVRFTFPGAEHSDVAELAGRVSDLSFDKSKGGAVPVGSIAWGGEYKEASNGEGWGSFPLKNYRPDGLGDELFGEYNLRDEYSRIGLSKDGLGLRALDTTIDLYPQCADTYPTDLYVPSGMTNDELRRVCAFRSRGRIPVVAYHYAPTGATMSRSSQPLVGLGKNRSIEDEKLIARLMNLTGTSKFYIMDARKKTAATGNKIMGKGTEDVRNYKGATMLHMDIANIHACRESQAMLWDLCRPSSSVGGGSSWLGKLDSTGWMQHVHSIIAASARAASIMTVEGISLLVHCSDGWDRTAQICALAEILIDPNDRTFRGFRAVVEKEWLCFGHKFADRIGAGVSKGAASDDERSPIFTLFLDCLWQIMRQHENAFEYNSLFLVAVHDQLHSGRTATFNFNSKKERIEAGIVGNTYTAWDVLATFDMELFRNKHYEPTPEGKEDILVMNCNPKNLRLWEDFWLRFDTSIVPFKKSKVFF